MAVHRFDIALHDPERGVNEELTLRTARHPSETPEYLITRVLAWCLEYEEGIAFAADLSTRDAPALEVRDDGGELRAWIEVGLPGPRRLQRALRSAPRVVVYPHRDSRSWHSRLRRAGLRGAERASIVWIDPAFLGGLAGRMGRHTRLGLSREAARLVVEVEGERIVTEPHRLPMTG